MTTLQPSITGLKAFIQAREAIRLGHKSNDYVLNNSRFCNINREDDKVSTWIFMNCRTVKQILIARIINHIDRLEQVKAADWNTDVLTGAITNSQAYQFYPRKNETIRTILADIEDNADKLEAFINKDQTNTTIEQLSLWLSSSIDRSLHFYFMMVILDAAYIGFCNINMNSKCYAGPGGHKITKALGMSIEQIANELNMTQYTTEHALCEYRKYIDRTNNGIPNNRKYAAV